MIHLWFTIGRFASTRNLAFDKLRPNGVALFILSFKPIVLERFPFVVSLSNHVILHDLT
jgi:hypothetical protein